MQASGNPSVQREVDVAPCKPCCIAYSADGNFLLVGGSSKALHMYTKDGVYVHDVAQKTSWIWACAPQPGHPTTTIRVVCGCEDGSISLESINMPVVYTLYKVRRLYGDFNI
jgi:hypothetical protein